MENANSDFSIGIRRIAYHHELKRFRDLNGYSQGDIADFCGISKSNYGNIERLISFPNEELAVQIADLFEVAPEILFPKWTMPVFNKQHKLVDRVVEMKREMLASREVMLLEAPDDTEEVIDKQLLKKNIKDALKTLSLREAKVLELRFGLDDDKQKTLEETARKFGVTRERIRQVEIKALRRLRHPSRRIVLSPFL